MPGPFFWFFALVALATLATAIAFAFRPAERTLAVLRPLCAATICSALAACLLGVVNGLYGLNHALEQAPDAAAVARVWRMALPAFAESPGPLILGFAAVSVAWLLAAVGLRRQA
jgi:hypothetical protein